MIVTEDERPMLQGSSVAKVFTTDLARVQKIGSCLRLWFATSETIDGAPVL